MPLGQRIPFLWGVDGKIVWSSYQAGQRAIHLVSAYAMVWVWWLLASRAPLNNAWRFMHSRWRVHVALTYADVVEAAQMLASLATWAGIATGTNPRARSSFTAIERHSMKDSLKRAALTLFLHTGPTSPSQQAAARLPTPLNARHSTLSMSCRKFSPRSATKVTWSSRTSSATRFARTSRHLLARSMCNLHEVTNTSNASGRYNLS